MTGTQLPYSAPFRLPWDRSNFAHHSSGPGARWPELARLRANSCSPHTPLFVSVAVRADDYTLVPNEGVLLHCLAVRHKLSSTAELPGVPSQNKLLRSSGRSGLVK